jgi:ribulose-phosphate 3-epimerase
MTVPPLRIAPSLLSCDFARIAEDLADVERAGADWHHVDVMDGHFVPNITIGPPVVKSIHAAASIPLDVHLMITDPAKYAPDFAKAGAEVLTFHIEVADDLAAAQEIVRVFRGEGISKVGVALNPGTQIERVADLLDVVDLVLVMSVQPGFGGQSFQEHVLPKVSWLRQRGYVGEVEMDGGLNLETLPLCVEAGANALVAGSAIYGVKDRAERISSLRRSAEAVRS